MSLSMQAFHTRLFSAHAAPGPLQALLAQLTRLNREQIVALKSNLEWIQW
jgi:hypothetical protein